MGSVLFPQRKLAPSEGELMRQKLADGTGQAQQYQALGIQESLEHSRDLVDIQ